MIGGAVGGVSVGAGRLVCFRRVGAKGGGALPPGKEAPEEANVGELPSPFNLFQYVEKGVPGVVCGDDAVVEAEDEAVVVDAANVVGPIAVPLGSKWVYCCWVPIGANGRACTAPPPFNRLRRFSNILF